MIVFENPGSLDLKAITTFGVSVKTGDNPIGMFGTGSKYAISIFLRNGFTVKLVTEGKTYNFSLADSTIRGKQFQMIMMNDTELPFTTHLGMNWELWQAFREFHCNASDEGGDSYLTGVEPTFYDDHTYIIVDGPEADHLYYQKPTIILNDTNKIELSEVDIIEESSNHLYYRGIRVMDLRHPAQFTYNIKRALTLTEDRTLRAGDWAPNSAIASSLFRCNDKKLIRKIILQQHNTFERSLSFGSISYFNDVSQEFAEVVKEEFENNNDELNSSLKDWISDITKSHKFKKIKGVKLSNEENEMYKKAQAITKRMFPYADYPVTFCESLGRSTMAFADAEEKHIYISKDCFDKGSLFLASTLLEEITHLYKDLLDETRELQTFLFDNLTVKLAKEAGVVL